jgi:hypothetical protein
VRRAALIASAREAAVARGSPELSARKRPRRAETLGQASGALGFRAEKHGFHPIERRRALPDRCAKPLQARGRVRPARGAPAAGGIPFCASAVSRYDGRTRPVSGRPSPT